jgi:peptide/nickel transport system substrate-binding protein
VRRVNKAAAVAIAAALAVTACGSPSSNNSQKGGGAGNDKVKTDQKVTDPAAKGPAEEIKGAKKGGIMTVYSQSTPNTLDPSNNYYTDAGEISKLVFRTATQFDIRNGEPVLVPDLTDLGTESADKLTWTFKWKTPGLKYADGTQATVQDLAYAIKRSFAHDIYTAGPTYQVDYFKDGDKYKGPYKDGETYAGVETPDASTLVIHLAKPFPDLPFFMAFPMFTPIPKAKDTKQDYQNAPMATGPYQFETFTPGSELKLKRNTNWDAKSDPVRHAYVDGYDFKWGQEDLKTQQQVLNSNGPDANALNYIDIDASFVPQLTGDKAKQLVRGGGSCVYALSLDTTKIPLEVRKAIAKAYPYDQIWKAAGLNEYIAEPASTFMPPSVPGYKKYPPVEDLTGKGTGDPAAAKKLLEAAGKTGFEVSWYYDNTKPIPQQTSQIRADALTKAGFTAKPVGVSTAELRSKIADFNAPVNMGQGPAGWCSDWPNGNSWIPVLFKSSAIESGQSWGEMTDKDLDAKIDAVSALPADQATAKWGDLDKEIMEKYVALPRYYTKSAILVGTNVGNGLIDSTQGMPFFLDMYLKG